MYQGGSQIIPISIDIENWVRDIRSTAATRIIGASDSSKNKIVWSVPADGSETPNALFIYDYLENKWTRRDIVLNYITTLVNATDVTWTKLTTELGYTTWESLGNVPWSSLVNESLTVSGINSAGHLYTLTSESDDDEDFDGYRIEPALAFAGPHTHSVLLEIWFSLVSHGNYSIYVKYRGADTEAELRQTNWTTLDEVSCDNPVNPVCRLDNLTAKSSRLHQIKWGTDAKDEKFVVSQIEFRYVPESRY